MNYYQTKSVLLSGSNYGEIHRHYEKYFRSLQSKSKRQPYVRSAYFLKQKIFLNLFWIHLFDKSHNVRAIRLKYLPSAIELLEHSRIDPVTILNLEAKSELFHRFYGLTKNKQKFVVQVKQIKSTGKLYFMSVYPI